MSYRVLVSDNLAEEGIEIFRSTEGIEVDVETALGPEELKAVIPEYDAIAIRSATKLTEDVIAVANKLKVIGRAGIGVDNVDTQAATKKGIVVMNTPEGNTITTAEHAVSMLLSMARRIPQASMSTKSGKWEKKRFIGKEVFNKTLGIIGIGRIGRIVADRAKGLHMNVIAFDPFIRAEAVTQLGVEMVSLEELLQRADFITIHTPKTKETANLIDERAIEKMKPGAYIVNCARGGLVNEQALYDGIVSGKIAGAALDVYESEPPNDNPLLKLEQVICTPHLGASTEEAQVNVAVAVAQQITDYLLKGSVRNAVNMPSVSAEILVHVQPYIEFAEKLGSFTGQVIRGGLMEVHLEYAGEVARYGPAPISVALIKGLLSPIIGEGINYVNAQVLAKDRGINIKEVVTEAREDYSNLITIRAFSNQEELVITGALLGKNRPRILTINNYLIEAIPEGTLLFLCNDDRPGVIGRIATLMGSKGINIGTMHCGRDRLGGTAVILLNLDDPVPQEVIDQLQQLEHVLSVTQIEL